MSTETAKMTNQEQEMVHLTINNIPLAVPTMKSSAIGALKTRFLPNSFCVKNSKTRPVT